MTTTLKTSSARAEVPALVGMVLTHAVLFSGLMFYLIWFVPGYDRTFKDFNMALPAFTQAVLTVSAWITTYIWLVPLVFVLGMGSDTAILVVLRRDPQSAWPGKLWFMLVTVALCAALIGSMVAMQLPYAKLMEGLSR